MSVSGYDIKQLTSGIQIIGCKEEIVNIETLWKNWSDSDIFSGVFSVRDENGVVFEKSTGFRNRSEQLPNKPDTAFGIASGTKLFTGLSVCTLIDEGKLSLNDKLWDLLPYDLGQIDKQVTVFHLLTHTSGVGDYLDEEDPNSYEHEQELCNKYPVYLWERLEYYLQMNIPLPPKFTPGERFGYSNAGFVLLGLVIEAISGVSYQQYVTDRIILPLKLNHTGFYRMNELPANTALGYIGADPSASLQTNIFSLPIRGGADGGLYTCAKDLDLLWRAIFDRKILSDEILQEFLNPQVIRSEGESYGLGVYRHDGKEIAYYAVGGDFGVDFFTVYFPKHRITASALGNTEINTYPLRKALLTDILE